MTKFLPIRPTGTEKVLGLQFTTSAYVALRIETKSSPLQLATSGKCRPTYLTERWQFGVGNGRTGSVIGGCMAVGDVAGVALAFSVVGGGR